MKQQIIGVLGATSLVGDCLLSTCLTDEISVVAFSRRAINSDTNPAITWSKLNAQDNQNPQTIKDWICLAPIWVLPDYFAMLEVHGIQRIVALSSTSRFTKTSSSDSSEQQLAAQLIQAEQRLEQWAQQHGVEWIVLRPTLIYGLGRDKNISAIMAFIKRFGFFPLFGAAKGKRQPIRLEDVAKACILALNTPAIANRAYNISGGETLSYDDMVKRIFATLGKKPCLIHSPLSVFRLAIKILHILPRFRKLTVAMAERMNQDMIFDCSEAKRDLNFEPSPFRLEDKDIV